MSIAGRAVIKKGDLTGNNDQKDAVRAQRQWINRGWLAENPRQEAGRHPAMLADPSVQGDFVQTSE